jgi:hypothetical protein
MAKSNKNNKNATPSVKVQDLAPEKNPKGGAVEMFDKSSQKVVLGDGSVIPAVQNPAGLNFKK